MGFETTSLKNLLGEKGYIRGPFGSALKRSDMEESGIPVYEQQHAIYGTREFRYFINPSKYKKLSRFSVEENDLIISCSGTVGRISLITSLDPIGIISQALLILRPKRDKALPKFLYYFFSSQQGFYELTQASHGAVQLNIAPRKIVEQIQIPNFSINQQKNIVKYLNVLDNKIQLNTQINQTLEAMAQAIFKSWFVDFDPVRAKRELLDSGGSIEDAERAAMRIISSKTDNQLDEMATSQPNDFAELQQTASLFPSQLVDSELGEIPEGWEVNTIENICWLNQNSISKKDAPEKVKYVDLGNTKWGEIQATSIYDFKNAPSRARRILKRNDTIIGTVRPRNGSYAYIYDDGLTGSTGFAVLTPKDIIFSEFLYFCATNEKNIERLGNLADGGAYPAVNSQLILNTPCVMPNCELEKNNVTNSYHKITSFIMSKVYENYTQNQTLAELRDTLLPKLLSGELDVSGLAEMQDD